MSLPFRVTARRSTMRRPSLGYVVAVVAAVGLMNAVAFKADAQSQLTLLSPNPIETTINKLTADFEKKSGVHVNVTYGTGVGTRKTVASGQALDVSLLFAPFPECLLYTSDAADERSSVDLGGR